MILQWSDDLSVGVELIDDDHKKLVLLTNNLQEAMKQGSGKRVIGATLNALLSYTRVHFDREEAYMEEVAFPDIEWHKTLHRDLLEKVESLHDESLSGDGKVRFKALRLLRRWLLDHIRDNDALIGRHVRSLQDETDAA